ncbi:hypothetical protein Tco_0413984 [Tanacetum coccineum]
MTARFATTQARILEAQSEASKGANTLAEMLKGLDKQFERKKMADWKFGLLHLMLVGILSTTQLPLLEREMCPFEALYEGSDRTPLAWALSRSESKIIGPERVCSRSKLSPRYVGLFKIIERVDPVSYGLCLPQELVGVHDTFHVSNLKKCLADVNLYVPLEEVKIDDKLLFFEEPMEIMDREVKKLKRSRIPIVKVVG